MRTKPPTRFFHIWSGSTPDQRFGICIHETADFTPGSVPPVVGYCYRGTVRERPSLRQVIENVNPQAPQAILASKHGVTSPRSGTMKNAGMILRRAEIEFFLRLFGLWQGIVALTPPPDPPFNIETMELIDIPNNWGWTDHVGSPPQEWWTEGDKTWHAPDLPLDFLAENPKTSTKINCPMKKLVHFDQRQTMKPFLALSPPQTQSERRLKPMF